MNEYDAILMTLPIVYKIANFSILAPNMKVIDESILMIMPTIMNVEYPTQSRSQNHRFYSDMIV